MAESSSKRPKSEENDGGGTDRMSSLPDSVLCHILSFLPTKTCVATSLVSRRWRHLWQHLHVLDFSDDSHHYCEQSELFKRFAFFVTTVLALRRSRHIRKMRLYSCLSDKDTFYANSAATWVRAAIGPRLEELHLTFCSRHGHGFVVLPPTLFTCTNLVSLSVCGGIRVNVQHSSAVRLPSLKMLKLDVNFVDSVDALLSGCPVLETLDISFAPESFTKVRVPPSLKRLRFTTVKNLVATDLVIDAPGLKYLSITQTRLGSFGNLQSVVEANLDVFTIGGSVDPLLNLLRALSGTKYLVLHRLTTTWLFGAPVLDFPEFRYLLHLELILPSFKSNFLLKVLQSCHMLQVLIIDQCYTKPSRLRTWGPESTNVPNCLVSHLTCIRFKAYRGSEVELEFAEYILRKGLVLKAVFVIADLSLDLRKKYCILKKLSDIPRGSSLCQLKFD